MATQPSTSERNTREAEHFGLERLVFFSDAVFAIAITLLALEIHLPSAGERSNDQLAQVLLSIWPKYQSYIISFLVIGLFWMAHHRKFRYIERYDNRLILLNLLLLMSVAFIPFPTAVIGEYGNRSATIFYAFAILATNAFSILLWLYATRNRKLVNEELSHSHIHRETQRAILVSGVFILSIGLAFVDDNLAKLAWVLAIPANLLA
jgi:uncharacterized membrane protein